MNNNIRYAICLMVMILTGITNTFAQSTANDESDEIPEVRSLVKIAPFQFIDNTFFLMYEGFNADYTNSINIGLGFKTSSGFNSEETGFKYELQYRFYVDGFKGYSGSKNGNAYRRGIYASIFFSGLYTRVNSTFSSFDPVGNFSRIDDNTQTINAFNPGVTLGLQRSFWDILYIDFYVGGGVRLADVSNSNDMFPTNRSDFTNIYDVDYQGVFPKIGVNLGIGF